MVNEKESILGIDPGEKRIGLAIAHKGLSVATGLGVIQYVSKRRFIEDLKTIADEENVRLVVMGLPLNMDGSEGESAKRSRRLAELITVELGIQVKYVDELLTSERAEKLVRETGAKPKRSKGTVDMIAAVQILQSYLDREDL